MGPFNLFPAPLTLKINSIALTASKMNNMLRNNAIIYYQINVKQKYVFSYETQAIRV